ncbi:transcriptional regulator, partial [Salmonella enterica]
RLQCQQAALLALLGILVGILINFIALCLASARKKQGKVALVIGWFIHDTTRLWLVGWVASQEGWRIDVL